MTSTLNEPEEVVLPNIAPLLDAAVEKLGENDRRACALRRASPKECCKDRKDQEDIKQDERLIMQSRSFLALRRRP